MSAQIGNLQVRIGADIGDLQSRMRVARNEVAQAASVMNASLGRLGKGFAGVSKSAEDSAQAFVQGRKAANDLLSSIDPLYAAQDRYNKKLAEAQALLKNGSLTTEEFAKVQAGLKSQLAGTSQVFGTVANSNGRMRAGFTQLSFQLGDVSQQFALGVSPMRIFAQQGGQIVQAFQVMGGEGSKFLKFIGGPWGAAISAATVILIPLISKLFEGRDALSDLIKKKQEDARQTALSEQADRIWSQTLDGLIDRHKKLNEELSKRLTTQEAVDRDNLARQQADLDRETQQLAQERKRRDDLQKQLVEAQQNPGIVSGVAGAVVHG